METITVYQTTYDELRDREFKMMTQLAEMKGTITALSGMEENPEFVFKMLKEMVDKFDS